MSVLSVMERAGTPIPVDLPDNSIRTIFGATDLDWTIEQEPVYSFNSSKDFYRDDNGNYHNGNGYNLIPNVVANYRSDNHDFLGFVHPKKYKIVSNLEAFDFIDQLPNFTLEKVGMFDGGRKVFVIGKSNEQIIIDGTDDKVDFYLTFLHGHDGKSGIRFILCPIRMFCMNQLNLMLHTARFKYSITHVGDVEFKLKQIQLAIADSRGYVNSLSDTIQEMINHKPSITINRLTELLLPENDEDTERQVAYKEDVKNAIIDLYETKDDLQNYKGTSFGMLSAVSDYVSHADPRRNGSEHTINNAFISSMEGNNLLEQAKSILLAA